MLINGKDIRREKKFKKLKRRKSYYNNKITKIKSLVEEINNNQMLFLEEMIQSIQIQINNRIT